MSMLKTVQSHREKSNWIIFEVRSVKGFGLLIGHMCSQSTDKPRFDICKNANDGTAYIRAIQGHHIKPCVDRTYFDTKVVPEN